MTPFGLVALFKQPLRMTNPHGMRLPWQGDAEMC
jgi:hypothetical protein